MLYFESDYTTGAHPAVLQRLVETNAEHLPSYGGDPYSTRAKEHIRAAAAAPQASVHFLTGGTQTNKIIIGSLLRQHEGVIAAATGHIALHEAGAIEATGHKVLTLPAVDGKLQAADLELYLAEFYADENHEHMVHPGMVYISHPTEYGTLYSKAELEALHHICQTYHIPLYLDGARLGYGLMSPASDMTLEDIAALCDVFYIGGTKVGALCGEAVVFPNGDPPPCFLTVIKQYGALLAKGRLTGVQFDALFTDGLYFEISRQVIAKAMRLRDLLKSKGYTFLLDSPTNQQFIIVENDKMERLREQVSFNIWEPVDQSHTAIRLAIGWSTTDAELDALEKLL